MNINANNYPIRKLRLAAGLSQEKLAREAQCSLSTVRLAERGWLPSETITARLAAALGCEPDALSQGTKRT